MEAITLSPLGHTWILDLDGTIVKHNGYKLDGYDTFLDGAEDFLYSIPETDMVVFITSREAQYRKLTEDFLHTHGVRYNHIVFGAPFGERILINDKKPSGLEMSLAVNIERDKFESIQIEVDDNL